MIDTGSEHNVKIQQPSTMQARPYWVAHRGGTPEAPENSLSAFRMGAAGPAQYIEGDFRLTADQHIIACHDATTWRATGIELEVSQSTLESLQQLHLLPRGPVAGPAETFPTLEQVLELLPTDKGLFLEIKGGPEMVPRLAILLESAQLADWQVVVIAFDPAVVRAVRKQLPQIKVHWLYEWHEDLLAPDPGIDELINTALELNAHGLGLNYCHHLTAAGISKAHSVGLGVHIYTVNEPAEARYCIGLGVDSITSDYPDRLISALEQLPMENTFPPGHEQVGRSYAEDALTGKEP